MNNNRGSSPNPITKDPNSRKFCVASKSIFSQQEHTGDGQDTLTKTPSIADQPQPSRHHVVNNKSTYRHEDTISFRHYIGRCMLSELTKAFDVIIALSREVADNAILWALISQDLACRSSIRSIDWNNDRRNTTDIAFVVPAALTNDLSTPMHTRFNRAALFYPSLP